MLLLVSAFALVAASAFGCQKPVAEGKVGAEADRFLEDCVPFGFAGSALVVVDGHVVLRKGYGLADPEHARPNTPSTLFDIGSLTKQFTATAILLLRLWARQWITFVQSNGKVASCSLKGLRDAVSFQRAAK
jgi:CubicO group peptidase (beta-lactamase class C family)